MEKMSKVSWEFHNVLFMYLFIQQIFIVYCGNPILCLKPI